MDKKPAFVISLILTLLIAINIVFISSLDESQTSTVIVERVIDGDTLTLSNGENVRLININSPERARPGYDESKNFLSELQNKTIEIQRLEFDKYGRTLARIYDLDYINLKIVEEGFANKYLVRESELDEFSEAERKAIEEEKGIWKKSDSFDCLTINLKEQLVSLENSCDQLETTGWRLKDESRKEYNFPDITINKDEILSFDPSIPAIWSEKRNSIYIFDSEGNLIYRKEGVASN